MGGLGEVEQGDLIEQVGLDLATLNGLRLMARTEQLLTLAEALVDAGNRCGIVGFQRFDARRLSVGIGDQHGLNVFDQTLQLIHDDFLV